MIRALTYLLRRLTCQHHQSNEIRGAWHCAHCKFTWRATP